MERIVIYLVMFSSTFFLSSAFTSKHIIEKLDYIEDRLNAESTRLNAESKFRKGEFNLLLDKVEGIETMLKNVLEKKETQSASSEISDKTMSDISSNKMMTILLKSFEAEKLGNKRFKREVLQDVNKQAELTKEAYERVEKSLEFITKKIGQLEQQTLQNDIDSDKLAGQVIQILEENARNTTFLLYSSMQNTINKQAEQTKEAYDRVENSLDFITKEIGQFRNETRQDDIDSDKIAGQRIQKLDEHIKSATSILNSTMQKTVSKQGELMKEACERVKNSLDLITKEIGLLNNETSKHDIALANTAGQVIRNIEENTKHTTSILNSTVQKAVNKQIEQTKEANDRVENGLDYITKEIGQLKRQTLQHDIDSGKSAGQVIQILGENSRNTMSLLNSTLQNTINKQAGQMSKAYDRVENSLGYMKKEIEQIKDEARHHHIDSDKVAKNETALLNRTMQNTETILVLLNDTAELIKEQEHWYKISQTQLEDFRFSSLNTTHGLTNKLEVILEQQKRPESCLDLFYNNFRSDGVYHIQKRTTKEYFSVYCDMTTDGGGWTVFQRRQDGSEDFYRDWNDYKNGFGKLDGEFWLGNEYMNLLTDDGKIHELRIDLEDYEGDQAYAKYNKFKIGPESTYYKLEVSGYTGNAGDSLNDQYSSWGNHNHNGMQFSTKDRENDLWPSYKCASKYHGAWWFNTCLMSHLNGLYIKQKECTSYTKCIIWYKWKGSTYHNMKFTEMKFR